MTGSRPLIAAMQVTLDGYLRGPEGEAGWVDSWADGLGLLPPVDAFVLGGGMFPDYERFWTVVQDEPATAAEWLGRAPYPRELDYARVAAETPHLVVSTTLRESFWPSARIVPDLDAIAELRAQPGNPVYVVGGPTLVNNLIDAGLLDELRLIVHPIAAGTGLPLFRPDTLRRLELVAAEAATGERVNLTYRPTTAAAQWAA